MHVVSLLKFGRFEKGTKFEKIFHSKFDATQTQGGRFFQILWPFQKIRTLRKQKAFGPTVQFLV